MLTRADTITDGRNRRSEKYSDFSLGLEKHPDTNDILRYTDINDIKKTLKNIILTNNYERLYNPSFGCNIRKLLFENITAQTISLASEIIKESIIKYEPRVRLDTINIKADPDMSEINIVLTFLVLNISDPQTLSFNLNRVR